MEENFDKIGSYLNDFITTATSQLTDVKELLLLSKSLHFFLLSSSSNISQRLEQKSSISGYQTDFIFTTWKIK